LIIQSETGRLCRVQKPCPGQAIRVLDTDTGVEVLHTTDPKRSDCVVFNTEGCRAYELKVVTNQP